MRVLIADDEPAIRTVLRRVLMRHFPVEVVEAENGLQALERLSQDRYSFAVLDVTMPVMTGTEALRALRRHPQTANLPVIMMTANTDELTVRAIMHLGVSDYVIKPMRPRFVVERVARLMDSLMGGHAQAVAMPPTTLPIRIGPRTRALLVDGSADFRRFFAETVGQRCRVSDTASGTDALKQCLDDPPDIVFVGSETGVLSPDDLAQKLREAPRDGRVRLVRIQPPRMMRKRRGDLYDATISRTFMATTLLESVDDLTKEQGSMHRMLALAPQLKVIAMASIEQAAALSLGTTITPREFSTALARDMEASVPVSVRHDVVSLEVSVGANVGSAKTIAARLHDTLAEEVTEDQALSALGEFAMTVTERLAEGLQDAGVGALPGEPSMSTDARKKKKADDAIVVTLESCPAAFSLYLRLEARRRLVA
jgi:CheY-like chemotaxis protein